jgi:hypothetical protein
MILYEAILVMQKDKPIIEHLEQKFDQVLIKYCLCIREIF